jgi:hypothetical protein
MTPAEMLKRALAATQGRTPQPITDEFAKAIAKRLEARGIVKVPGLEDEPEPDPIGAALDRYQAAERAIEAEREAKRLADEQAAQNARSTPDIIREAVSTSSGSSGHIPLNGAGVLRAALAGGPGTINGQRE